MKKAKCTNCGANIEVNENNEAGICPYCNCAYITEKAVQNYSNQTNNNAQVINNYYGYNEKPIEVRETKRFVHIAPPRPKVNVGLAIFLCLFYIFPGLIYLGYIGNKQREWDEKYGTEE